jgi:hypothetical protein
MNKVWHKILPFPVGTKVKVVKEGIRIAREDRLSEFFGKIGYVIGYVDEEWKENMIHVGCYPPRIREEKLYEVKFEMNDPAATSYAFRYTELEVV